ncbi:LysR family transcriptional regulator [Pendulispora albinea]|uniref:LysR family transcriptional regulator n=1 Tax=Pendulispora albinea TaxID=2741071 RepID=A0ABZ2LT22_9BACT
MIGLHDYPSLALFARVVHLRSFSAAAREAGIAKSAVSRRIAQLEELLGVRLLQRSTRAIAVTEEGLRVYEQCAALVAAAAAAEEVAGGAKGDVRGTLRVNAPVTFAQMYLARTLAEFLAKHPGLEVHLSTEDRIVDMVEGGFDIVIRIGRLANSTLVARKLASDRLVVCASPAYLRAHGEPSTPQDLASHECLHYGLVARADEWRFRGPQGPLAIPTRGRFVATNGTVLREAALAGAGLVVLPLFMVAREVAAGELRLVLEGTRRAAIGIYAVTVHRTHAPPKVRAFLDFAAKYFEGYDWTTKGARI